MSLGFLTQIIQKANINRERSIIIQNTSKHSRSTFILCWIVACLFEICAWVWIGRLKLTRKRKSNRRCRRQSVAELFACVLQRSAHVQWNWNQFPKAHCATATDDNNTAAMVQQTIKHNKTHLTLTQNSAQQAKEQQNTRNDRVIVIPPDRNRPSRGIYTIFYTISYT